MALANSSISFASKCAIVNSLSAILLWNASMIIPIGSTVTIINIESATSDSIIVGNNWLQGISQCEEDVCRVIYEPEYAEGERFINGFEVYPNFNIDEFCEESSYSESEDNRTFIIKPSGAAVSKSSVIVKSCVQWKGDDEKIERVEGMEVFYKWIVSD